MVDLVAKEAVVSEATEVRLQDVKADLEATVEVHLLLTDLLEEKVVFHLIVQKEKADFLKERQDVLIHQDLKLQELEDQEKTNLFS